MATMPTSLAIFAKAALPVALLPPVALPGGAPHRRDLHEVLGVGPDEEMGL